MEKLMVMLGWIALVVLAIISAEIVVMIVKETMPVLLGFGMLAIITVLGFALAYNIDIVEKSSCLK